MFQSAFVHSFLQNTNMAPEQFGPVDGEIHPGQALTIQADPFVQSVLPANPAFTDAIFWHTFTSHLQNDLES